ncbi:MAG: HAD hydrolase family protein [Synechococcaceae cyanobacterium SM2_3_1]|nr:HAD hydrolase family protein [Synechococcaceae cyanobacterium SM2_3_1]
MLCRPCPQGGFIYQDWRQFWRDLKGGLLGLTWRQLQQIKKQRQHVDLVLAVGDSESDSHMFAVAGRGVALANAPAAVHARAHTVAPLAHGAGVIWALQQFVLDAHHQ